MHVCSVASVKSDFVQFYGPSCQAPWSRFQGTLWVSYASPPRIFPTQGLELHFFLSSLHWQVGFTTKAPGKPTILQYPLLNMNFYDRIKLHSLVYLKSHWSPIQLIFYGYALIPNESYFGRINSHRTKHSQSLTTAYKSLPFCPTYCVLMLHEGTVSNTYLF